MTKTNVRYLIKRYKKKEPLEILVVREYEEITLDIKNGFLEKTNPRYKMRRMGEKMVSIKTNRYVPTELGMDFLRFKIL